MVGSLDFDLEEKSIRNYIISILARKYPLQAKEIYEIIKAEYMKSATYPAVYKNLKMLTKEKKLLKKNRAFSLNIDWIKHLKRFSNLVEQYYTDKTSLMPGIGELKEHSTESFSFENLHDADNYRKRLQIEYVKSGAIQPYCALYNHLKSPIVHSEKSLNILSVVAEHNMHSYLVVSSNTPLDKWCAKFYEANNMVSVKVGAIIPSSKMCETMVLGDLVVQTYIPPKIENYIEYIYKKTKKIDEINVLEFHQKVFKSKSDTRMVLIRNKQIADHMRTEIMSYFRKKR